MMRMSKVFLLRHGESTFNAGNDVTDAPLTCRGEHQAAALSGHYDLVVCSPLTRARQTLEHSNITYDKLIICHEAREHWTVNKCSYIPGEAMVRESEEELIARCNKLRNKLFEYSNSYKKILVVGHGITFYYLTSLDENGEISKYGQHFDNCELVEFDMLDKVVANL